MSNATDREWLKQLRNGHGETLRCVYEAHKDSMLALAIALSRDRSAGEDVVHDVFVAFARLAPTLRLRGSLRSYLLTAVANRVRSLKRRRRDCVDRMESDSIRDNRMLDPANRVMTAELLERVDTAIGELAYEQRETIVLHLQTGLPFREIARLQAVSLGTVLSRYRYGLSKLRTNVNREARS